MIDTVFHYHATTGEYAGNSPADHSPLEPGVVLIPAHATDQRPPDTGAREVAVFRNDAWHVALDWRGVALFSIVNGAPVTIDDIGMAPVDVNATEAEPPSPAHVWTDGQWVEDATVKAQILGALKLQLCRQLDTEADTARRAVIGDPLRAVEYERAADEALAYQATGYAGDVPPSVQSAVNATGNTARQTADAILAKHAAWDAVLYDIRAQRLKGKETIRNAASEEAAAQATEAAIACVRGVLAGLTDSQG
ncbi:phage tail protein [Ralstonia nicotianae]|uniref:Phage tail protein n=1 Tax=Ralstonia pseudosolanacearum TaxID=1310165 RepID=A0A454TSR1_9RALS|nr:hypothetical protein [Ralstonia pseudosolanacearum]MCK4133217.1 phage tail protein [Ralstonia pseudosolanacearum]MDK1380785.1 phage tail protein [Ralstonia pseudosolanacearum]RAA05762.1 phage tail protein [Ralstonia pseudosolanacearum]RNM07321.1 phage tail protein [Ralstonia pseudosolanacearum]